MSTIATVATLAYSNLNAACGMEFHHLSRPVGRATHPFVEPAVLLDHRDAVGPAWGLRTFITATSCAIDAKLSLDMAGLSSRLSAIPVEANPGETRDGSVVFRLRFALGLAVGVAIALHFAPPAHAVDEIQVYNAEIAPLGTFTLQQHLNYVWRGVTTPDFPNGIAPDRTLNGTPELAYGVTDWYEIGLYAPFTFDSNGTFLPGGVKLRHLFVSPHAEQRKFFYGLNIELSYQTPRFSESAFATEFRPILGVRDLGWEFIVNPIVDVSFGPTGSVDFAPALRLARNIGGDVMLGVEYYTDLGPIGVFGPSNSQQHSLFAVIDFNVFGLDVNFGVGFGLTDASNPIVTKLIIGRAF